jgi:sugar phosphate isomerase/epimerase
MKLSVFTVMLPDLTPEEAAQALQAAGYDGVEWRVTRVPEERRGEPPSFWGNNRCTLAPTEAEARRARSLAQSAGLAIPNLGTYIAVGDLSATEEAMRFAQVAGAEQIRVGVGSSQGASYAERFAAAQAFLTEVEPLALRYGVRALVEIHHRTICPSASLAHRLVSHFDPQAVGVIYDPGNMVYEGFEDYDLGIELLGPYLAHVHLKNGAFTRPEGGGVWTAHWAPLEDGVVDFPQVLAALRATGYDGWLSMEDFSAARPSREALRHNLAFIRGAIARASDQGGDHDG